MLLRDSGVFADRAAQPIRVLLVDDSAEFLESATRFLATDPMLAIIGRALSALEALKQIELLHPDLALIDLTLPDMNGLELTSRVKSRSCPPLVIIVTLYAITEYSMAAETALADGWVAKSAFGAELLPLIHTMFARPAV